MPRGKVLRAPGRYWRLLTVYLAVAFVYMLFLEPWGHDTWFHLQRLLDVQDQLSWDHPRAHLAVYAAQGKGIPVWVYYSQWIYWPAMVLTALGVNPLIALKLLYGVILVVCCVGCHRLLRLHAGPGEAAFGTLLFMTANYVIGEVFVRSAYAEFLSVAWLPLLLLAMHRTVVDGNRWAAASLALLAALVILPHPLSFMNSGVLIVAYGAYIAVSTRVPFGRFLGLVPLFALALALTAFFWVPAVVETRYVLGAEGVPTPLRETFISPLRYLNFSGITNLGFVLTGLVPLVAACLWLRRGQPQVPAARTSGPLLAGIAVYVFLTLRVSEPIYTAVPFLESNLWVWRVFFQMTLLAVIFVTANLPALPPRLRSDRVLGAIAMVAVLQAAALVGWNTWTELSPRRVGLDEIRAEVARDAEDEEGFGVDEYLPHPKVVPHPPSDCRQTRTLTPQGIYEFALEVAAADAGTCLHVPRYWNVRYAAWIGGIATPVYGNEAGEIVVVPGGRTGTLVVRFTRPSYVTAATFVSLAAAALLVLAAARIRR